MGNPNVSEALNELLFTGLLMFINFSALTLKKISRYTKAYQLGYGLN